MPAAPRLISVAVPVPFLDLLTYRVPDPVDVPAIGARVVVPLGTRVVTGCVVGVRNDAPETVDEGIRDVIDVLDDGAYVPPDVIQLALWVADYYAAGPGEALALCMPPYAAVEGERLVTITERGRQLLDASRVLTPAPSEASVAQESAAQAFGRARHSARNIVLDAVAGGKPVGARRLASIAQVGGRTKTPIVSVIRALERDGLVTTTQTLRGRAERFKTIGMAALSVAGRQWLDTEGAPELGPRQRDALEALGGAPEGVSVGDLAKRGIGSDTLKRLSRRGLVVLRRDRIDRDPLTSGAATIARAEEPAHPLRPLTPEQRDALDALDPLVGQGFHAALLHGVTGSGKTEIYLRLAARAVAAGRTALMLVPEIALTPAVAGLLRAAFGDRVAIQHSGLSHGERYDQWHRIRRGEVDVVVGTRSAVFAPLARIGLIVVDEEHDSSYKQDETPRYNGRDVAVVRGKRDEALVVLGSATPSMETFHNALQGRYAHVSMGSRILDRPLARVQIVDMREEYAAHGPDVILSDVLKSAIERRLREREQSLVLLNRRGLATAVFCRQCAATLECPNCSLSLIVHGEKGVATPTPFSRRRARCHYCNYSRAVPAACDKCAGPYLDYIGFGTARVEQAIAVLFPDARVARLDHDSTRRRGSITSILNRFGDGDIDVLVGTQMIAKGHDFPRVTLVGVISADVGLGMADFRAGERTFQLLTQVAGRAGRGHRPGEAIVQTLYPDHYSIKLACRQDYRAFFDEELRFRTAMRYPPIVSLVNTIVRAPTFSRAMQDAEDIAADLRRDAQGHYRVLGPAPAPLGRLRGEYRVQFFLKGAARSDMRRTLMAAIARRPEMRRRVTVDVDPMSVL